MIQWHMGSDGPVCCFAGMHEVSEHHAELVCKATAAQCDRSCSHSCPAPLRQHLRRSSATYRRYIIFAAAVRVAIIQLHRIMPSSRYIGTLVGSDEATDVRVGSAARDCVYALCEWRDTAARQLNEGRIPNLSAACCLSHALLLESHEGTGLLSAHQIQRGSLLCPAGVQHVMPGAAVWQLAQQRPHDAAEVLSVLHKHAHAGAAAARLSPAQAAEVNNLCVPHHANVMCQPTCSSLARGTHTVKHGSALTSLR
jgi:hypothetical protein